MITNNEIKVPNELKGKVISIDSNDIRISYVANKIEMYPLTDIMDKEYSGTGLGFYNKEGNCCGANRIDMNIVEFCKVIEEYFKC